MTSVESIRELLTLEHYIPNDIIDADMVFCSICCNILHNPTVINGCRHLFCNECIIVIVESIKKCQKESQPYKTKCPICSHEFSSTMISELHLVMLKKTQFKCPIENCTEIIKYLDIDNHAKTCKFILKQCNYCPYISRNNDLHLTQCKLCNNNICTNMVDDHNKICSAVVIDCIYGCGLQMKKSDVEEHKESCTEIIVQCGLKYCDFKIKRRDLKEHEINYELHYKNILEKYQTILEKPCDNKISQFVGPSPRFNNIYINIGDKFIIKHKNTTNVVEIIGINSMEYYILVRYVYIKNDDKDIEENDIEPEWISYSDISSRFIKNITNWKYEFNNNKKI
jgi:hypothetical protein